MDDGTIQSALRHCQRPPELDNLMNDAADEIERLRSGLAEIDLRGKQYAADELADMARAVLDGKDPESVFNKNSAEASYD